LSVFLLPKKNKPDLELCYLGVELAIENGVETNLRILIIPNSNK
jgi:hypothetical protein